jgi:hypothetical protein
MQGYSPTMRPETPRGSFGWTLLRESKLGHYPAVGAIAFAVVTEDTQGWSTERRDDAAGIPIEELVAWPMRASRLSRRGRGMMGGKPVGKGPGAVEEGSMSNQNISRRDAVKLGGAALATAGLAGAAAGAGPAEPAPTTGTQYPNFHGKTVSFQVRAKREHQLLSDPVFEVQGGRLFVTGTCPVLGFWPDGLSAGFAWDLVESYCIYESVEDYRSRTEMYKKSKEAKAEPAAG